MINGKGNYRRNGKKVYIKQPQYKDLAFVQRLWSDEETMRDIGGTFAFTEEKWEMFYKKLVFPTDGKNFYCLVYTFRDKAIGEVSFHGYDSVTKIARFNVKIHYRYRNKGYAEEALKLMLEYYFLEYGGEMMMDSIPTDAGVSVARKLGFTEVGTYKDGVKVKLAKEDFLNNIEEKEHEIGILMYDGMNMSDYAVFHDTLNVVNNILNKEVFKVNGVAFKDKILLSNGFTINTEVVDEMYKPQVIVIPSSVNIEDNVKDKEIIRFIMKNFNDLDYLCSQENGIKFLIRCRALEGLFLPKIDDKNELEEYKDRISNRNFVDNGKILLSANNIGELQMILSLVCKLVGEKVSLKLRDILGIK